MTAHPKLLSTAEEITELANSLRGHPIIAFDTEFIRESTFYPVVEIIQVATLENSWLVDAQAFKKKFKPGPKGGYDPGIQPLLDVFMDKSVLKILHAAQGDQECLYTSFGVVAEPVLDTAVAASLCGMGEAIGLGKLLKAVLDIEIKKGHARTNWSVRPLPEQLVEYAHADVDNLVLLAQKLMEQLDELGRKDWALELSAKFADKSMYDPEPESIALKLGRGGRLDKKGYPVLVELVKWREERVKQLNLPRRWVADDAILIDLAQVRPKDMEHLSAFRGLNKGELKNSGDTILAAIKRATDQTEGAPTLPRMPKPDIPTPEEAQVLDLLRCYVGILADKYKIAAKHLMTTAQLLPILRMARSGNVGIEEVLSGEAARLIGDELIAFMKGERALSVDGTQIKINTIKNQQ